MHRSLRATGWIGTFALLAVGQVAAQQPTTPKGPPAPQGTPVQSGAPAQQQPLVRQGPPPATLGNLLDSIPLEEIPDSIRQQRMVHVSPHLVVFTPGNQTAVLQFSNRGTRFTEADVEVQYGFTYWQNEDTTLVPAHGVRQHGRDTVIFNPGPNDRSAVQWLSGIPSHIALAPGETKQVSLKITPPPGLPDGEYYARIVTLVGARAKRDVVSQDVKQTYRYPVKSWELPVIRDSVRVFYRQGAQTMGLNVLNAKAKLDPSIDPPTNDEIDVGMHPLQILTQLQLTGTTHFEGIIRMSYVSENGDEIQLSAPEGAAISLHKDGIIRWVAQTDHLPLGRNYHLRLRFFATQDEFAASQRLPMKPIDIELPIYIPETAARAPAVSTGQDLYMGNVDPYWSYIKGIPSNLSDQGSEAIVDTAYNYSDRQIWPWAMRTMRPGLNVNGGWLHPNRTAWGESVVGPNTMRTFVTLPSTDDGTVAPLTGSVWSDDKMVDILVNGKPLATFDPTQTKKPAKEGYTFRIEQEDGLTGGDNVLDFVWHMKYKPRPPGIVRLFAPWYVIRVDFNMIFREMHNK